MDYGNASMLITGDLEERGIADLIARNSGTQMLDVDGYVVGHHGSYNATSVPLLQAMTPTWAVVEVGPSDRKGQHTANTYGHPRSSVVTDLLQHVSGARDIVFKRAATGKYAFVSRKITKAIYATGWDGTVVLEASTSGVWRRIDPQADEPMDLVAVQAGKVNINTAGEAELERLPMIGPARARAIVASRQLDGSFGTLKDLTRIRGIGEGTVRLLRRYATP